MILPDTLAPLPVAEDASKPEVESEFVTESAIRQLLVGSMALGSRERTGIESTEDFAFPGRVDFGDEVLFAVRDGEGKVTPILPAGPHPAFVPRESSMSAPVVADPGVRSVAASPAERVAGKKTSLWILGSAAAAGFMLVIGWRVLPLDASEPVPTRPPSEVRADSPSAPLIVRTDAEAGRP
ncbi:hypothetical protein HNR46_001851 [Haloferula luteola]|uniref:Uncharacterized protein n=1 Tax=Haloferula luteola TaxID=595692 RepID=A0A840V7Q0_9BACT|nr:hypothetical protein [Haloferula luteola]MBB5351614.1 hypothetical protein [Haloferula luteola]